MASKGASKRASETTNEIESFVADFHAHFTRDPNACVELGVPERTGDLPDPSATARDDQVGEAESLIRQLNKIDSSEIDFDTRIDLELAELKLSSEVHCATLRFNDRTTLEQMPQAGDQIGDGIFLLFMNDPRPDGERLLDVITRLEAVPRFLQQMLARLDHPLERWVEMDCEKVAGLPQLFSTLGDWADETNFPDRTRLTRASAEAEATLAAYATQLASLPTTTSFQLDSSDARRLVRLRGIEPSLEDLHAQAGAFLEENAAVIEELRGRLSERYGLAKDTTVEALQEFLAEHFRVPIDDGDLSAILRRYEKERESVLAFIREHDLFPVLEDQDMKILQTPSFMAPSIPAGAMLSPPPFREGVRTSLVYLTLSPELLDEHTELGIPGMMIHEGIPGHHLQLATASTHPSRIRRHISAMEHAEGWTTMLEDYMLDVGYMGDLTDEARFVGKRDINRIGARVAIDLFFMTGERSFLDVGPHCDSGSADPFEAAGSLLHAATGFTPGRTQAELNWYSQERGYPLCYLTGNRLVWKLKQDVAAAQQGKLEGRELDRAFHRLYLESGNMPVSFLRRVFEHEGLLVTGESGHAATQARP